MPRAGSWLGSENRVQARDIPQQYYASVTRRRRRPAKPSKIKEARLDPALRLSFSVVTRLVGATVLENRLTEQRR